MALQIEQTLPKCRRCGRMTHERDPERIDEADGLVFCSERCREEYRSLQQQGSASAGTESVQQG